MEPLDFAGESLNIIIMSAILVVMYFILKSKN